MSAPGDHERGGHHSTTTSAVLDGRRLVGRQLVGRHVLDSRRFRIEAILHIQDSGIIALQVTLITDQTIDKIVTSSSPLAVSKAISAS